MEKKMIDISLDNIEDEVTLKTMISDLSERDKKIITMAMDGYSCSEIGETLDITEQWVLKIVKRFKERWEKGE